jgi:hypothetical protein
VIFVADEDDDRPVRARSLLEGEADARRVSVALDQVIGEVEGVQKAQALPSRPTPTRRSDGSAFISR